MDAFKIKPLPCDPKRVKGMSEKLIISHYENNYGGAVKRLNLINEQLAGINFSTAPGFLINGLKREQLRPPKTCAVSKHSHDRSPAGLRRFLGLQQQRAWMQGKVLVVRVTFAQAPVGKQAAAASRQKKTMWNAIGTQ